MESGICGGSALIRFAVRVKCDRLIAYADGAGCTCSGRVHLAESASGAHLQCSPVLVKRCSAWSTAMVSFRAEDSSVNGGKRGRSAMHLKTTFCVVVALVLVVGPQAGAELVDFSQYPGGARWMEDEVITLTEGGLAGIQMTFDPDPANPDTPGWFSYEELLQGAPYNEATEQDEPIYVLFSGPVTVPSLKIRSMWGDASDDAVSGWLGGVQVWGPVANTAEDQFTWQEVTAGAGIPIDTLKFDISYADSELDDITVTPVPEPGTLSLLAAGACLLLLRRRRR
jgi:hypothetical protein